MDGTTIGIMSDIHGDLESFNATLSLFDQQGVSQILCAGDIADREWLRTDSERGQGNESRSYRNWVPQLLGSWTHTAWQYAGTSSSICALPGAGGAKAAGGSFGRAHRTL